MQRITVKDDNGYEIVLTRMGDSTSVAIFAPTSAMVRKAILDLITEWPSSSFTSPVSDAEGGWAASGRVCGNSIMSEYARN